MSSGVISEVPSATVVIPDVPSPTGVIPDVPSPTGVIPDVPSTTVVIPEAPSAAGVIPDIPSATVVIPETPKATGIIPEIVVTEPSPLIQNPPVTSVRVEEKAVPTHEVYTGELIASPKEAVVKDSPPKEETTHPEQRKYSSDYFFPAVDCKEGVVPGATECVVPVPATQPESDQAESSEIDSDEFRTYGCCHFGVELEGPYANMWNILENRYAIPFWVLAMALPVSAGIMGAIYMFSCSAAEYLPNTIFTIGMSLLAALTIRVCIIIHRMTWEDEGSRAMLQTINLICIFITSLFYITENVAFWQMNPSTHPGALDYCHPTFTTYTFWWNIATAVLMAILYLFPIA